MKKILLILLLLAIGLQYANPVFADDDDHECEEHGKWTRTWTDDFNQTTYSLTAPCVVYLGVPYNIVATVTDSTWPNDIVGSLWNIKDNGVVVAGGGFNWITTSKGTWQRVVQRTYTGSAENHTVQFNFKDMGDGAGGHSWATGLIGTVTEDPTPPPTTNISMADRYAWSENAGWFDFRDFHGGVLVHPTYVSGYAWAENIGWVKLGSDAPGPYANTTATNWGVNDDGSGNLSGFAWSETSGWINMHPTNGGVTINRTTGIFDGYAWSENLGWIHFNNAAPAYKVVYVNIPPSIVVSTPTGSGTITSTNSFTINWTATDPDSTDPVIKLYYDQIGSGFSGTQISTGTLHLSDPGSFDWDIAGLAEGTYYIYATIDDGLAVVNAYASGPLTIDRTKPGTPVVLGATPTKSLRPTWTWTSGGSGNGTYQYQLDSLGWTTTTAASFSPPGDLSSGSHTLYVKERDAAGNWSTSGYKAIEIDCAGPALTVSTLADGAVTNVRVLNITGSAADSSGINLTTITLNSSLTGTALQNFNTAMILQSGTNTLAVSATDALGNLTTDTRTITYDTAVPGMVITGPTDNSIIVRNTIDVTGALADPLALVDVIVNGGAPQAAVISDQTFTAAITLDAGINTIEIVATDLFAKTNSIKRTVFYDNLGATVSITEPKEDIVVNQNSTLIKGTVADAPGSATISIEANGLTYAPILSSGAFEQIVTFGAENTYPVTVTVKDIGGNTISRVQRNIIYKKLSVTLAPDKSSPQVLSGAGTITFTAHASEGAGNYEYRFWLKTAGTWTTVQNYSATNTWSWNTTGTPPGTYGVQVYARNIGSSAANEGTKTLSYDLIVSSPATSATLNPDVASPQMIGSNITFTAGAAGGSGTYDYKFWLRTGGTWTTVQDYSPTNTWTWHTAGAAAGTYAVQVYVRNTTSSAKYEATKTMSYVLVSPPASGATLSPNTASPQTVGANITFTAGGIGGSGDYEYRFWLKAAGVWTTVQAYSTDNTWTWDTTGLAPGTYRVQVYVRNVGSSDKYEAVLGMGYVIK